jgi:DNA-binding transcriptional LysR family regulator
MELNDLQLFTVAARHSSLQRAAEELHLTPSALSKAIKRLEESLRTPLFDRVGKGLQLNAAGQRLQARALALLQLAEQTRAEFAGSGFRVHCRVAAPALLQARYAASCATALARLDAPASMKLIAQFEDEAMLALLRGEADFALVSAAVLTQGAAPDGLAARSLETLPMRLALAPQHPLAQRQDIDADEVLLHDFVCPTRSLLCGLRRGTGSDGWRDDVLPRRIRFLVDDLHTLLALVHAGQALAYLPGFLIEQEGLGSLTLSNSPFHCEEQTLLLWRPTQAFGWQARWVSALENLLHGQPQRPLPESIRAATVPGSSG